MYVVVAKDVNVINCRYSSLRKYLIVKSLTTSHHLRPQASVSPRAHGTFTQAATIAEMYSYVTPSL